MPFPLTVIDGNFSYPREVEGSPQISVDEVTQAKLITRLFVVLKENYDPLPAGAKDPIYKNAYLINENETGNVGPFRFFARNFAELPEDRVEPQQVSFTMPGRSSVDVSFITGKFINFNPYGAAAPYTREVTASAAISYELNPAPPVGGAGITVIRFNGAPVDFVGVVFKSVGNEEVERPGGVFITEGRWELIGFTSPGDIPGIWTMANTLTRWRGPIWERRILTVNAAALQVT